MQYAEFWWFPMTVGARYVPHLGKPKLITLPDEIWIQAHRHIECTYDV
jgi:hypothetical protein